MKIVAAKNILRANEQLAGENRRRLDAAGVYCVNLVGSPGSGKTTLLEAVFALLRETLRPAVIEGDLASQIDADRIQQFHRTAEPVSHPTCYRIFSTPFLPRNPPARVQGWAWPRCGAS